MRLAGHALDVAGPTSAARVVLAQGDGALAAACAANVLDVMTVATLLARRAPERLAALLCAALPGAAEPTRPQLLLVGAAALPRGALSGAVTLDASSDGVAAVEHLAPERVAPFSARFALRGEALVAAKRLPGETWTALRAIVQGGVGAGVVTLDASVIQELARLLPLARAFDEPARRFLGWMGSSPAGLHCVEKWCALALRAEAAGEDAFAVLDAALRDGGLTDERRLAFLATKLTGGFGVLGVSSFGRWVLALEDDALRALAQAQLGPRSWATYLFGLVAQEAPQRSGVLLEVLGANAESQWHRVQAAMEAMALCGAPGVAAFALERARAPLPAGDDPPAVHARLQARQARLAAWKLLVTLDRAQHLEGALAAVRAALEGNNWLSGEAVQWLVRTLVSDAHSELVARLATSTNELAPTLATHLLGTFGAGAPEALEWHFARPHGWERLSALRRLIDLGAPLDARAIEIFAALVADPAPSVAVQALDTAAAWDWVWAEPRAWEMLVTASARARLAAASKLAAHRTGDTWPRAEALLGHKQAPARLGAIALLARLDAEAAAGRFEARLDVESSAEVRDQLLLGVRDSWKRAGRKATWADVEKRLAQAKPGKALAPWLDVAALPPLHLADGRTVPREAVAWLLARQARIKGASPGIRREAVRR